MRAKSRRRQARASMPEDGARREFVRSVGVALVSLLGGRALGCTPAIPPPGVAPPAPGWDRLRRLWLSIGDAMTSTEPDWISRTVLVERSASDPATTTYTEEWVPHEDSQTWERSKAEHRAALDGLVAAGELRAPVADLLQLAFEEAADHVVQTQEPLLVCYDMPQIGAAMRRSRERFVEQIALLDEMVRSGAVRADLVAASREEAEFQLAFFDEVAALRSLEMPARSFAEARLADRFTGRGIEVTALDREAANVLIDLLLGEGR